MKQKPFPPSCAPQMTRTGVTRQFRELEQRVLLQTGRKSLGREVAAHRQGSPGDVPGGEEACRAISADCRLMSRSGFLGQASLQGLAILARWCHPSMGLLPALEQPSRVEEEEEEEGASQHPVSLRSLQGCLGTPGPAAGGGSHNCSPGTGAAAHRSLHPRLLEVTWVRTIQAFWEIKPLCLQSFLVSGWSFLWCLVEPELPPACRTLLVQLGHAGPAASWLLP